VSLVHHDQQRSAKPAPTLRGSLLFGNMTALQRDPLTFNPKATSLLGHVVRVRAFPGIYVYLATAPSDVEHVLQTNQHNYRKPDLFFKAVSLLAGKGILTSEGDFWLHQRRLIQPGFHRSKLAILADLMAGSAQSAGERLSTHAKQNATIDVADEMMRLTLKVVSVALFSTDISGDAGRLGTAVRDTFEHVSYRMNHALTLPERVPTRRNRRFNEAKRLLDEMVFGLINERRRTGEDNGDLLSMLLAARDEDTGEGMSDQQIRDEVLTMILAGHETTGAALTWTWYLLSQNREACNKLHRELDQVLSGRAPGLDDLERLPYARMVFAESMRLYPPAWGLPRETIEDDTLGGYHIPARSLVTLSQWVTQRHPDFWEKPEQFDPERFTPERSEGRPRFAYFPFGGGARQCIGNHFALMEAQLVIATLAQRFTFDLVPGHPVEPDPTFTLRPRYGMLMTVNER
jgi:cytochrome P450